MLTRRQEMLLDLIAREYIETAAPVGSQALVERHDLPVSPATVRNDMGELEEAGFIVRPHSSSGAVPSDIGYRHYVETLLDTARLTSEEERTIRHQFHQVELELEQWSRLAVAVMARMAQNVALATLPRAVETRWRRLELILLHEAVVLTILILQEGHVRQQVHHVTRPVTQEELNSLSTELNSLLAGSTYRQAQRQSLPMEGWRGRIVMEALTMMKAVDLAVQDRPYIEGLSLLLGQPEFATATSVQGIVAALEEGRFLQPLVEEKPQSGGVRVIIGEENPEDAMRQCTLLLANYGEEDEAIGVVGVLGPRRMDYRRAIPLLHFMATLLTELNAELRN